MARIQILELPAGLADERPPFALVIDQVRDVEALGLNPTAGSVYKQFVANTMTVSLAEQLGARAILCFEGETVDIPANGADLAPALLFRADDYALTEMTRSRDEWRQRSIRTEETLERLRGEQRQAKADLGFALAVSKLGSWDDIVNAARSARQTLAAHAADIRRVRDLHRAVEHHGQTICAHCSAYDGTGATASLVRRHPCATVQALDARPAAEAQPEPADQNQ